jgi:hypothetical protein
MHIPTRYLYSNDIDNKKVRVVGGKLATQLYDKRDDFDFVIVNFPHKCSNIPLASAYGVYISFN